MTCGGDAGGGALEGELSLAEKIGAGLRFFHRGARTISSALGAGEINFLGPLAGIGQHGHFRARDIYEAAGKSCVLGFGTAFDRDDTGLQLHEIALVAFENFEFSVETR